MANIRKILIANRGEIAVRLIKTCNTMGISTVAVYSQSDTHALHAKFADEAICIGNSPSAESYLNIEKIIAAVKQSGSDAIHPGYGFLSENSTFAKRCEDEKIIFIGPPSGVIEKMGSKASAKEIVKKCGVPVVPGYEGEDQSLKKLVSEADKAGFPVLLKASAGGGGKGMRIVHNKEDMKLAVEAAQREAKAAFGNERLIIEKYFESCRHIEIQIFGDQHGNVIHLFERECSIQRRHQKIIEESPSPALTNELREEMAAAAIKAAKAIHYSNAGTVEFILTDKNEFFFLEVNTRLQVEHPVTEMLTGLDLVKLQIEVAQGHTLSKAEKRLPSNSEGIYAIECRIYAEDPYNNFLPQTGKIFLWKPADIAGVRCDSGIETGSEISIFYDPLLAKIIAKGENREEAIRKMVYVLKNTVCLGITTNIEFLISVLNNENFQIGNYNTRFVETTENRKPKTADSASPQSSTTSRPEFGTGHHYLIAALIYILMERENNRTVLKSIPSGWRNNFYQNRFEKYLIDNKEVKVEYQFSENFFQVFIHEKKYSMEIINYEKLLNPPTAGVSAIKYTIDGLMQTAYVASAPLPTENLCQQFGKVGETAIFIHINSSGHIQLKQLARFSEKQAEETQGHYKSPMPGEVVKVSVKVGESVKKGDTLVVLLSMKMENIISAHTDGIVEDFFVQEKSFVQAGAVLLKMKGKQ